VQVSRGIFVTTITGAVTYSPATIQGQISPRQAGTGGTSNSTGTASATAASSAKTLTETIAAAANSASYDFATVGKNARTVLDAGIAANGQPPGSQTTSAQWTKMFGGMDRRSLFAVSSNQGGQFSAQEQQAATSLMATQLANVGNVSSSASTQGQIAGFSAKASFLNNVSPEEKNTASWAYSMADAQTSARMADINSRMPQPSGGSQSLVNVLMGAMYNTRNQSSTPVSFGTVNSLSDITSQPWAASYASQIESAFAASYQPGGSFSASV
jgi:hypothetical protein